MISKKQIREKKTRRKHGLSNLAFSDLAFSFNNVKNEYTITFFVNYVKYVELKLCRAKQAGSKNKGQKLYALEKICTLKICMYVCM